MSDVNGTLLEARPFVGTILFNDMNARCNVLTEIIMEIIALQPVANMSTFGQKKKSFTLQMEAFRFSETPKIFCQTTRHYIFEDCNVSNVMRLIFLPSCNVCIYSAAMKP